ncbi:MAG: ATP-binding cassette domain-containing protein [Candidatus Acetothermia bacterium]|jgi:ABC-2 type transport system ATP-binding protein|nr:ATP-binding cassette domain-containing protein [Candidatus Acetothermia bacterium]
MAYAIEVEGLVKVYRGGVRAVDGVSFSVEAREIFGFLGPNGAGKSTTIKCVVGLLKPTAGTIRVQGVDVHRDPGVVKRTIGYAAQETAVDDRLTGWENLCLQGRFYHLPRAEIRRRGEEVLQLFGLWERRKDLAETYSGGMLKRLDIACALIHRPKILFLDEPTLGLDVQTRKTIWEYIERLREEHAMTIFLTTHYMEEADALSDRVAIIDRGRIVALDTPGALKAGIGGDLITVRFAAEDGRLDGVLSAVRALPGVREVKGGEDGIHRIVVEQHGDRLIPEIVAVATRHGVGIASVRLKRPTLDDVYLHYTGQEIREAEGTREEIFKSRRMQRRARR